ILVRSPAVMLGYWEDGAGTQEAVDPDGWLHTGDLGHLDDDGYLFVTGRAKSLIVLDSGKKVQPEEVELALARSEMFAESCVVGWSGGHQMTGEQVCAVVVPTARFSAAHPDRAGLEEAAAGEVRRVTSGLSGFKRPSVVRVHEGELPKTAKRSVRQSEVLRLLEEQEVRG
ncbi:MAG: AMP-binding protein, partial [Actinobacteria bacterium]|nr:AMP-binding protein [Actinomycetota bacterium]